MSTKRKSLRSAVASFAAAAMVIGSAGTMPAEVFGGFAFTAGAEGSVAVNETNFPDAVFRAYVSENVDKDNDGVLSPEEIAGAKILESGYDSDTGTGCHDLEGIQYFTELTALAISGADLNILDLSGNTKLKELSTEYSRFGAVNISGCGELQYLDCSAAGLTSLDLSGNTKLESLYCNGNRLTSLDISNNLLLDDLDCSGNKLTTLDISNNTVLKALDCRGNDLTSLDLSGNTKLVRLDVAYNKLSYLDLSAQAELQYVDCRNNCLAFVDLSNAKIPSVVYEYKSHGAFLSDNAHMIGDVSSFSLSQISGFDPDKASNWTNCVYNSAANTISDFTGLVISYDYDCGEMTFTDGEKKRYIETFSLCRTTEGGVEISVANFPDEDFRTAIATFDIDNNGYLCDAEAGMIKSLELSGTKSLVGIEYLTSLEQLTLKNISIKKLNLGSCPSLKTLICSDGNSLTSLDVSKNVLLQKLDCGYNMLETLDVGKNTELTELLCSNNRLIELDLSKNTELTKLDFGSNYITAIDLTNNRKLETFSCDENNYNIGAVASFDPTTLKNFDITKASNWYYADFDSDTNRVINFRKENVRYDYDTGRGKARFWLQVSPVDVVAVDSEHFPGYYLRNYVSESFDSNGNGKLSSFEIGNAWQLEFNDSSETSSLKGIEYLTALRYVHIERGSDIDLSHAVKLNELHLYETAAENIKLHDGLKFEGEVVFENNKSLRSIDFGKNTVVPTLYMTGNGIACLDLSNCVTSGEDWGIEPLFEDNCYDIGAVTSFKLTDIPGFDPAKASNWSGATYIASTGKIENFNGTAGNRFTDDGQPLYSITYTYNCGNGIFANFALVYSKSGEPEPDEEVGINAANFPDAAFRAYISESFDTDKSGTLSESEINAVTSVQVNEMGITSLKGIEYFTELTQLRCNLNELTSLDVSANIKLTHISCRENHITSLDVSMLPELVSLECHCNALTSLDVTHNPLLYNLHCNSNDISSIDVSKNPKLQILYCGGEKMTDIDVSHNPKLIVLGCGSSDLIKLDVSHNPELQMLYCGNNWIRSLDLSNNPALTELYCNNNCLTSLDLTNNTSLTEFNADGNGFDLGEITEYELARLPGFDPSRSSFWRGAKFDETTGTISSFTSDNIWYDYDCGGGHTVTFLLNVTLPDSVTVTFDSMGGSEVGSVTVKKGESVGMPVEPEREGYTFVGWYIDKEYSDEFNFNSKVTADITLYAKWEEKAAGTFVVTFDSKGGTAVASQTVIEGGLAVKPADPLKEGYRFLNWYYDESAPKTFDFRTPIVADLTLYANWGSRIPNTVLVVFDTLGGTEITTQLLQNGGSARRPADPEKAGYKFMGWFLDKAYATPFTFKESITADTVVYAKWERRPENSFIVTFRSAGSDHCYQYVENGKTVVCPEEPVREGYIFAGWLYEEMLYSFYDFSTPVTEDITLYAQWEPEPVVPLTLNGKPCKDFKALTDEIKNGGLDFYWIVVSEDYKESKAVTFPKGNYEVYIVGKCLTLASPTITANADLVINCPLVSAKSGKPVTIKAAKDVTVTVKKASEPGALAFSGTTTSTLKLLTDVSAASVMKFGKVVTDGVLLTVLGKMTGITEFDGSLASGTQTDIKNIGTAELTVAPNTAAKTVIGAVGGHLTVKFGDGSALPSGTQIFAFSGKTFPTNNVTVVNRDSDGDKQLNAFRYKKAVLAEYAGAIALTDKEGTDLGHYPNFEKAFEQMTSTTADYILTVEQTSLSVSKFALPSKVHSVTITGGSGLKTLDFGKTAAITAKSALILENIKLVSDAKDTAVKAGKFDLTLTNTETGAVTTTGKLTVNGDVKAYGAVTAAEICSGTADTVLTYQTLSITKNGASGDHVITVRAVTASKAPVTFTKDSKTPVGKKYKSANKAKEYAVELLVLDNGGDEPAALMCKGGKLVLA